ncbi:MAG: hypothetical protein HY720_24065 [Planctomycetes bacterium]|nr:hypothetical protein [Planctomycetota bacterium]
MRRALLFSLLVLLPSFLPALPALRAQELTPEEFRAKRKELEAAWAKAKTQEEKLRILEEFKKLELTPAELAKLETDAQNTPKTPGPEDIVAAAKKLVDERGENYGVDDPWWNVDPRHALPAGKRIGGLKGRWKCNLFGGNVLAQAGFEPPYYGNKGKGEYPNANQWFKWSDKYASKYGNKSHFNLVGELDVESLEGDARRKAIAELLKQAKPGDFIVVDHLGSAVSDGGHVRVVVENKIGEGEGTVACAQASYTSALVKNETVDSFTGEEKVWILRPNVARKP